MPSKGERSSVTDSRFAQIKKDPRFRSLKRVRKRQIQTSDERFAGVVLKNPAFSRL